MAPTQQEHPRARCPEIMFGKWIAGTFAAATLAGVVIAERRLSRIETNLQWIMLGRDTSTASDAGASRPAKRLPN